MLPCILVIALTFSAMHAQALHRASSHVYDASPQDSANGDHVLSSGELTALLGNNGRLDSYARKPDCFKRVATTIRIQCGELDMNEDERVKAAIAMTLCELATAKHSPPLECTAFRSAVEDHTEVASSVSCVEALSRSAQYWSSYSGYLREIPQLCHAFRRWSDVDTAKEVYRNVSLEASSVLRAINDSEYMQHTLQTAMHDMANHLHFIIQNMSSANVALDLTTEALRSVVDSVNQQAMNTVHKVLSATAEHYTTKHEVMLTHLASKMKGIVNEHTVSLELLLPSFQVALENRLSATYSEVRDRYREIDSIALMAQSSWALLADQFAGTEKSLADLVITVSDTASTLDAYIDKVESAQVETARSALRLDQAMADIATTAHAEIEKINATAFAVRNEWLSASGPTIDYPDWRHWSNWLKYSIVWCLQLIFQVNNVDLERVMSSRLVNILGFVCRFGMFALHFCGSAVTSIALLALSWTRWVSAPSTTSRSYSTCNVNQTTDASTPGLQNYPQSHVYASTIPRRRHQSSSGTFSRIPDRLYKTPTDPQSA